MGKKWTQEEINFLHNNTNLTSIEISNILSRTPIAIERKSLKLGIKKFLHKYGLIKLD